MRIRWIVAPVTLAAAVALAACGSSHPTSSAPQGSAPATAAPSAAASSAGHLHAEVTLVGPTTVTADGADILVTVNVTNDGPRAFGTQATDAHNVNLGAHAVNAAGNWIVTDLARGTIPEVDPGKTVKATIRLPVAKVLGYSAEILPVEENVAWFDKWGTKPLLVGPFKACSSPTIGKVCDAAGAALPTDTAQP